MKPRIPFDQFVTKLNKARQIDLARLAAYIDGEGCISISVSKPRGTAITKGFSLNLTVTNTDIRLLNWVTSVFGGTHCQANNNHQKPGTKKCWRWCICELQAEEILRRCLPYFIIKAEQAQIALDFRNLMIESRGKRGTPVTSEALAKREDFQRRIIALNSAKGFGLVKSAAKAS